MPSGRGANDESAEFKSGWERIPAFEGLLNLQFAREGWRTFQTRQAQAKPKQKGGAGVNQSALDLQVFHFINGFAGHPLFDQLVREVASNPFPRVVVLAIPYIFFWFSNANDESRSRLIAGLFGPVLAILVVQALGHIVPFELRPKFDLASGFNPPDLREGRRTDLENFTSFPSDTAAYCVASTLGSFSVHRAASIALTVLAMVLFCVPRIYLGVHYPSDILAGWIIGVGCAAITNLAILRWCGGYVVRLRTRFEAAFYALGAITLYELGEVLYNVRSFFHVLRILH